MTTLTIPKNLMNKGELVLVPRREYESMLNKIASYPAEVSISLAIRKKITAARKRMKAGKYLTLDELNKKLDTARR
jgi:hypothetical protein